MLDTHFGIFRLPYLGQSPLVEQHRHIKAVATGKGEIATKNGHLGGRSHAVVIRLHAVDGAALHRPKQLAGRNQLIGIGQLDDHLPIGCLVEGIHRRLDHMLTQGGTGIGLHAPSNGRLCMHSGRGK